MAKLFAVRLPSKPRPYSVEFQTQVESVTSWQSVLRRAYEEEYPNCCCPGTGTRQLVIRRRQKPERYFLARFPYTGHEHASNCKYYIPDPLSCGLRAYVEKVVTENDKGDFCVTLARGMATSETLDASIPPLPMSTGMPVPRQRCMTLLGLLHLIWTTKNLINWFPKMEGKRNAYNIPRFIREAAKQIKTNGVRLESVLLTSAFNSDGKEANRNKEVVKCALGKGLRLIAVGRLEDYSADKHSIPAQLPLVGRYGMPWLNMEERLWERVGQRFKDEIGAWQKGVNIVAIAHLSVTKSVKGSNALVHDVSLMRVSKRWIPLDSSYEEAIEERLHAEERAFQKPVRFDADECEYFPDFWLLDVDESYPMEVFGRTDAEYQAHRERKIHHYDNDYPAGWWYWDAWKTDKSPDFPPATKNYRNE